MHEIRHFLAKRVSVLRLLDSRLAVISTYLQTIEPQAGTETPSMVIPVVTQSEIEEARLIHTQLLEAHTTATAKVADVVIDLQFLSGRRTASDPLVVTTTEELAEHTAEQLAALTALDAYTITFNLLQTQFDSQTSAELIAERLDAFNTAYSALLDAAQVLLQWQQLEQHLTSEIYIISQQIRKYSGTPTDISHPLGSWVDKANAHCQHESTLASYPAPEEAIDYTPTVGYVALRETLFHLLVFTATAHNSADLSTEAYPGDLPLVHDWLHSGLQSLVWLRCSYQCNLSHRATTLDQFWVRMGDSIHRDLMVATPRPIWLYDMSLGPGVEVGSDTPPHHVLCINMVELEPRRDRPATSDQPAVMAQPITLTAPVTSPQPVDNQLTAPVSSHQHVGDQLHQSLASVITPLIAEVQFHQPTPPTRIDVLPISPHGVVTKTSRTFTHQ